MGIKQKILQNKNKLITWSLAAVLFVGGFTLGLMHGNSATPPQPNNTPTKALNQYRKVITDPLCPIKAKQSAKRKLYHLSGDLSYNKIKKPLCFKTEQEAIDAGFVKSPR